MDAQGEGVVEVLERQRVLGDAGDAEVVDDGTARHDEHVVVDALAVGEDDGCRPSTSTATTRAMRTVTLDGAPAAAADAAADGVGDVLGVQPGRGHLVQQRLEGVEVVDVEERDLDRLAEQAAGRRQAAEAGRR